MKKFIVLFVLLVLVFFIVACGSSNSLAGEYECTKHFSESMVGKISLDFSKDGTVIMKPFGNEGTYQVDSGSITIDLGNVDLTLKQDGNKLSTSDGSIVYEKK